MQDSTGVIAIPLSKALAIASGVPPQHGLYTVVVAGIVIALSGVGLYFNISGPTAAFVGDFIPCDAAIWVAGLSWQLYCQGLF